MVAAHNIGGFVHLAAKAMACLGADELCKRRGFQNANDGIVDLVRGDPCAGYFVALSVGAKHGLVDFRILVAHMADEKRAGDICAKPGFACAKVNKKRIATLKWNLACFGMWASRIFSCGNDRAKGVIFGALGKKVQD